MAEKQTRGNVRKSKKIKGQDCREKILLPLYKWMDPHQNVSLRVTHKNGSLGVLFNSNKHGEYFKTGQEYGNEYALSNINSWP